MRAWIVLVVPLQFALCAFAGEAGTYSPDANAPRSTVPSAFRWDLTPLYPDDEAWERALPRAERLVDALAAHRGRLRDAASVKACLDAYFAARRDSDRLAFYAGLRGKEDGSVPRYQEYAQRSQALSGRLRSQAAFIRMELARFDEKGMRALLEDASLKPYRGYIEDLLRRRARTLGEEAERVLGLAEDNLFSETDLDETPSDVERIFKAALRDIPLPSVADEAGKPVPMTLSNFTKLRASKDRRVRREAVEGLFGALRRHQDLLAATLAAEFKRDAFLARARGYAGSREAYLDRQGTDPRVVTTLIETIHRNLGPLQRYIALRRRLLKLDALHVYDLYTPMVPKAERDIPYREGLALVASAVEPLGAEYVRVLSEAGRPGSGWSDLYPNKGKEGGADLVATCGVHPFMRLNYQNSIADVTTLAHELGHAVHAHLNAQARPCQDFGSVPLVSETASMFNEVLLLRHLISSEAKDDSRRLYLLSLLAERVRTGVYRQVLFSEFEERLHALAESGAPLTAERVNKTYEDLLRLYYGEGLTLGADDALEWGYVNHFYWKHYLFTYAAGLSSGIALAERIRAGDVRARTRYLDLLAQPVWASPMEGLKAAGADPTKPDAVEAAARLLDETVSEMEGLAARLR